jgi:hypothetical protein
MRVYTLTGKEGFWSLRAYTVSGREESLSTVESVQL